jgi:hypothetical protein
VENAAAVEIDKGRLRRLLFDDFHKLLGKASQKPLRLFHIYHSPGYSSSRFVSSVKPIRLF